MKWPLGPWEWWKNRIWGCECPGDLWNIRWLKHMDSGAPGENTSRWTYLGCFSIVVMGWNYSNKHFTEGTSPCRLSMIEGSLEVKYFDSMDRWKAEQGRGREKRKIRREKSRRERVRRKKMEMREKVRKVAIHCVFFPTDLWLRRVEK